MKAYAVLSGGGAKGAALAGCLAAAEGRGIEWVGTGGTSAGALVAFLSAIGHSGLEIRDTFKALSGADVLDDSGAALDDLEAFFRKVKLLSESNRLGQLWTLFQVASSAVLGKISKNGGVYTGDKLETCLLELGKAGKKTKALFAKQSVTFRDLADAGCPLLKVVASNISTGRAVVFSDHDTEKYSVVRAIRASMGYPLVYQPVKSEEGHRLVDGGLASNLPCFLFAREHVETRFPVFAFDLVASPGPEEANYGVFELGRDILDTALEASDNLFVDHIPGVHYVRIPVPVGVGTFTREYPAGQIDNLFNSGFTAAGQVLDRFPLLIHAQQAGDRLQKQLQTLYGDKKHFQATLWALKTMLEERSKAAAVRAHIMLPTGRPDGSRIVVYSFGLRKDDTDGDLELSEGGGCTGRALTTRGPVLADLEDAKEHIADWSMTDLQQTRVPSDRKSMLSVPIFFGGEGPDNSRPIRGVLSVDSATPLAETGWLDGEVADAAVVGVMTNWANVCAKLLG